MQSHTPRTHLLLWSAITLKILTLDNQSKLEDSIANAQIGQLGVELINLVHQRFKNVLGNINMTFYSSNNILFCTKFLPENTKKTLVSAKRERTRSNKRRKKDRKTDIPRATGKRKKAAGMDVPRPW